MTGYHEGVGRPLDSHLAVPEVLRPHYALTLAAWCRNLVENWDECVAEVGPGTARVWGSDVAGSRLGLGTNTVQLHHVLVVKPGGVERVAVPLGPWWRASSLVQLVTPRLDPSSQS